MENNKNGLGHLGSKRHADTQMKGFNRWIEEMINMPTRKQLEEENATLKGHVTALEIELASATKGKTVVKEKVLEEVLRAAQVALNSLRPASQQQALISPPMPGGTWTEECLDNEFKTKIGHAIAIAMWNKLRECLR